MYYYLEYLVTFGYLNTFDFEDFIMKEYLVFREAECFYLFIILY